MNKHFIFLDKLLQFGVKTNRPIPLNARFGSLPTLPTLYMLVVEDFDLEQPCCLPEKYHKYVVFLDKLIQFGMKTDRPIPLNVWFGLLPAFPPSPCLLQRTLIQNDYVVCLKNLMNKHFIFLNKLLQFSTKTNRPIP